MKIVRISDVKYFALCLKFQFRQIYVIWISDEIDGVLLNSQGKIISFNTVDDLKKFVEKAELILTDDVTVFNIGYIQQWLTNPIPEIDYETFLNVWNIFTDLSASLGIEFIGDKKNKTRDAVYNKLFDRAGLFIEEYPNSTLDKKQIGELMKTMQNGLNLLLDNLLNG